MMDACNMQVREGEILHMEDSLLPVEEVLSEDTTVDLSQASSYESCRLIPLVLVMAKVQVIQFSG